MKQINKAFIAVIVASGIGVLDTFYLYSHSLEIDKIGCAIGNCSKVLNSEYAKFYGIPLSLIGLIYYCFIFYISLFAFKKGFEILKKILFSFATFAFIFSMILVIIQLFVLEAICLYCMTSAFISIIIFASLLISVREDSKNAKYLET